MARKKKKEVVDNRLKLLLAPVLLLLALGLACSLYLGRLYLQISSGSQVDSFCAINEALNCVTVATSKYSMMLGIPIALYGIEFFVATLAVVLLSRLGLWRVRRWDSLVFIAMLIGIPVCALLAWISATRIGSACIMCLTVYGVVLIVTLLLLIVSRGRIGDLLTAGLRELFAILPTFPCGALLAGVAALFISQFYWAPGLLARGHKGTAGPVAKMDGDRWYGMVTRGLTIGPADAPITIEEFTDFQCPYCGQAHQTMMTLLKQHPGKIRLRHRDYPLDNACNPAMNRVFHADACRAAYFARCASRQGKYWPLEALLFANRHNLGHEAMTGFARQVGLDIPKLLACVKSPATREAVLSDIQAGIRLKISGTPSTIINGEKIVGLRDLSFWINKVKELLRKPGAAEAAR